MTEQTPFLPRSDRKRRLLTLAGIFFLTLAVRWAFVLTGWLMGQEGLSGFFSGLYERLIQAGDAPHYLQIARNGYLSSGDTVNNIVFYPLYPLLIRCFSLLTGGEYAIAALLVSNLCLGLAGAVLWQLFTELGGERRGWEALLFLLCYPFGMFLTGIYTESLFLLLSGLCLLCLYRRQWAGVAVAGLLAALSRTQGLVLLVPAAYEWLLDLSHGQRKGMARRMLCLLCIPLGTGLYLLLNYAVTGDALAFVTYEAQPPWYNTTQWIAGNLTTHYGMALDNEYLGALIYWVQLALYFLGITGIFAGLWLGERTSLLAYGGALIFVSYLHGWLISGPRYMLACLPLFLLATRLRPTARYAVLALSAALGVGYMVMYLAGGAIM